MEDLTSLGQDIVQEIDTTKRKVCQSCRRPCTVCLCQWLPEEPIKLKYSNIAILQHPDEERRPLRTTTILESCLSKESCRIYRGRRFPKSKFKDIHKALSGNAVLLYPAEDAKSWHDHQMNGPGALTIVVIDGTWKQAKEIYNQNDFLHDLKKVVLDTKGQSQYVIRSQPHDGCLSTLECAALAIGHAEESTAQQEALMRPLRAMCQLQLRHGEQVHQPKNKRGK